MIVGLFATSQNPAYGLQFFLLKKSMKIWRYRTFMYICTPDCIGADKGSIAQLVQSICLTSRGSAVRTRVLPQKTVQIILNRFCFYPFSLFF